MSKAGHAATWQDCEAAAYVPRPIVLDLNQPLELGAVIGQGGMGIIHEAHQPCLNRTIAVKSVRAPIEKPHHTHALIAEGRVTGAVSHPNILPVHDLVRGPDGMPQLLLKRVNGRSWNTLMRDKHIVERMYGTADVIRFHVEVLEQVCSAVHAAHARDILHRDLKPGNVMVGKRKEVYLLDWGLGVAIGPAANPDLPRLAPDAKGAGTPHYMAPEMVSERFGVLGPWSDVYLLGGLLHKILFGSPPHAGQSVWNMLIEACKHGVSVPEIGPPALVDLCRRCLERRHEDRIQDAESVRRELRAWLDHRESIALAADADEQAHDLRELTPGSAEWARVYDLFGAAAFGYQRALADWPHNLRARRGLQAVVRWMVEHELAVDQPDAAQTAMAYLTTPPEALRHLVHSALERRRRKEVRAERWDRVRLTDDTLGSQSLRVVMIATVAAMTVHGWAAITRVSTLAAAAESLTQLADLAGILVVLAAIAATWGSLTRSDTNRKFTAFSMLFVTGHALLAGGLHTLNAPHHAMLQLCVTLVMFVLGTLAVDRRLWWSTIAVAVALVTSFALPDWTPWLQIPAYAVIAVQLVRTRWHRAVS